MTTPSIWLVWDHDDDYGPHLVATCTTEAAAQTWIANLWLEHEQERSYRYTIAEEHPLDTDAAKADALQRTQGEQANALMRRLRPHGYPSL